MITITKDTTLGELDRAMKDAGVVLQFRKVGQSWVVQVNTVRDTPVMVTSKFNLWDAINEAFAEISPPS